MDGGEPTELVAVGLALHAAIAAAAGRPQRVLGLLLVQIASQAHVIRGNFGWSPVVVMQVLS